MLSPLMLKVDIQTGQVLVDRRADVRGQASAGNEEESQVSKTSGVQEVRYKFVYFAPLSVLRRIGDVITLAQELVDYISTLKQPLPEYWTVGVAAAERAIEIRPMPKTVFGALYLYRKTGELPQFRSMALVDWLESLAVPAEVEVRYQEGEGNIVGQWDEPAAVQEAPAAADPLNQPISYVPTEDKPSPMPAGMAVAEPKHKGGPKLRPGTPHHEWVPSDLKTVQGKPYLVCKVCGLLTTDPGNPYSRVRPCYPGLYKDCYTLKDDTAKPVVGGFTTEAIALRLARLKASTSNAEVASNA